MSVFEAVLLGIVQGLTEFLPVSSSGHLVLLRQVFGIDMHGDRLLFFDTMVHAGTLAAVFAVLWRDILALLKKPIQPLTLYLIIATVPAVAAALAFRGWLERAVETGSYLGPAFLGTAAFLVAAELLSRRAAGRQERREPGEMGWKDALAVGLCQAAAVIPGISRSGATLSGALSRGLDRDFAARFAFLLSIPIIVGATVFQLLELRGGERALADVAGEVGLAAIAAGVLAAGAVGLFAVRIMLKIVREKSLLGFAAYTGVLGLLVLADQLFIGLFFSAGA